MVLCMGVLVSSGVLFARAILDNYSILYFRFDASMSCRSILVVPFGMLDASVKEVVTSILTAFSASSCAMRSFFWISATRHCLKYFT